MVFYDDNGAVQKINKHKSVKDYNDDYVYEGVMLKHVK